MNDQLLEDKKIQKRRDILLFTGFLGLVIGIPLFTLQFGDYRLIQLYKKDGQKLEAQVTDLRAEYYRRRTEYEVEVAYSTESDFLFYDTITEVLHPNTFKELSIGDTVEVLVLPQSGEQREPGEVLLYKSTTMEYWGGYYWRMIIASLASVYGVLSFIYAFLTRKQAVERVKRLAQAGK
jgi:hypothetical protein